MTTEARLLVAGLGLFLLLVVLRALRGHRIQFEYSILWICLSLLLVLAAIFQKTADRVAAWVGIDYPPAFFFLVCLFLVLLMLFHLTVRISVLSDRIRRLAQEHAVASALAEGTGAPSTSGGTGGASGGETEREHGRGDPRARRET